MFSKEREHFHSEFNKIKQKFGGKKYSEGDLVLDDDLHDSWAEFIKSNLHLLSVDSLEYAFSADGRTMCSWSKDVLTAIECELIERGLFEANNS
jgi:hypothetical protein